MAKQHLRTKHVATYLTEQDFQNLDKLASEENMSISSFIRHLLQRHIRRKLSKK